MLHSNLFLIELCHLMYLTQCSFFMWDFNSNKLPISYFLFYLLLLLLLLLLSLLLLLLLLLLHEPQDDNEICIRAVQHEMHEVRNQCLKEKLDEVKSVISGITLRAVELATQKGASSWFIVEPIRDMDFDLNKSESRSEILWNPGTTVPSRLWSPFIMMTQLPIKFIMMANTIHIYRLFMMDVIKYDEEKVNDNSGRDIWSVRHLSQYWRLMHSVFVSRLKHYNGSSKI